jgi:hypothetical protein
MNVSRDRRNNSLLIPIIIIIKRTTRKDLVRGSSKNESNKAINAIAASLREVKRSLDIPEGSIDIRADMDIDARMNPIFSVEKPRSFLK